MKKISSIQEQIEELIKKDQSNSKDEQIEYIDFNKSIEKMLTAKNDQNFKKNLFR